MIDGIYLDFNATTPLAPEAASAMEAVLRSVFGNPSSSHWAGAPARDAVEAARSQIAGLLGCNVNEIVFTSGGTEANNQAIKGVFFSQRSTADQPHFIISAIEHPAVVEPCRFLERLGAEVTRVPVDSHGMVDPEDVRRAIRRSTVLVSIMHANNEVGTLQPIEEIARIAHEKGVLVHSDAAQSVGKTAVDVDKLGVDLLTVAGHKLYGPKGVGALFIREGIQLEPFMHGAGHESGRRAGTENILEIVGLGSACALAKDYLDDPNMIQLRDEFWRKLSQRFDDQVVLNGHPQRRLPNTFNVSFRGHVGADVLARIPKVAASTGSACHAGSTHVSPVLAAMQVPHDVALGAVRFSLGRTTTREEIDAVVAALVEQLPPA